MATKGNPGDNRTRRSFSVFIVFGLCCFFYLLGAWQRSGFGKGDSIAHEITKNADCSVISNLNIETHHGVGVKNPDDLRSESKVFQPCDDRFIDYTPCHDQSRAMSFPRENMEHRERHCPSDNEKQHCLIPAPKGYVTPFTWPKSRDYVPFANAPYKSLTVEKATQNWIQYEGNVFRFPGGGTQFPRGVDAYIEQMASVVPIGNGIVRTALDTGCGVASLGAYLFKKNVITMSIAPRDSHEAQVQFALERGVPAIIDVLGTIKLPFPSRSFDMAHCSQCLIPWTQNDGKYMMEVDRVLRPGGYWVLSGPPINWRMNYKAWKRSEEELEEDQRKIEEIAKLLCWEKKHEKGEMAVWRKRVNKHYCQERESRVTMCKQTNVDDIWYKKMETCVTPYPNTNDTTEVAGGELKPFPQRLNDVPPIISSGSVNGISAESFEEDNKLWQKHLNAYKRVNKIIGTGRYRNIMDMNAGLGSFASALESPKSWVMNVMPTIAKKDTLGVIYERGLIGIYHDWCEAFSTYPRTYDLIHAHGLFSLYKHKCDYEDILLEMDRILRPEGTVIIRDHEIEVIKVKKIVSGMMWNTKMVDHEDGPLVPEKILFVVKQYWVAGENNLTSLR
ncbi:probable methyltransferase PMT2 isoform X1 [Cynara cardunculus var. scolymus]|uniref:probable methyltransferase PMT2 isoform X1 n=1 Tax=Cynara cardunculus var. scolymus TaxID=59895 RepID=UPI000D62819F|nr:probable methyltransferase PMT2 isoform X1 [Cynara cardunculus var. scolymus]XP_024977338.1 probable methyltransferase PMT2 isoform X1 [Cynara cardunculus var. scolymus]